MLHSFISLSFYWNLTQLFYFMAYVLIDIRWKACSLIRATRPRVKAAYSSDILCGKNYQNLDETNNLTRLKRNSDQRSRQMFCGYRCVSEAFSNAVPYIESRIRSFCGRFQRVCLTKKTWGRISKRSEEIFRVPPSSKVGYFLIHKRSCMEPSLVERVC